MSLVVSPCQALKVVVITLVSILALSSCTTQTPRKADSDPGSSASPTVKSIQPNLPDVELTPDLLYQILVSDIAAQRGNTRIAMAGLVEAARSTQDPRLAEQATRLAVLAGDYDTGIEMARLWVKNAPDDASVHQTLGNLYVVADKLELALPHYRTAIELTRIEHSELLLQNITETLVRYADKPEAIAAMQQLVDAFPESAAVRLAQSRLAGSLRMIDPALSAADAALSLDPDWEAAATYKFKLLLAGDQPDEAISFANSYLTKHKKYTLLRSSLARYYIENDDYKQAEQQYLLVHKYSPESQGTVMALALLRLQADDSEKARYYLNLALKQEPRNDLPRIYLGEIATSENKLDEAEQWLRAVTDTDQLFSARLRLAEVINRRDGIDAALRELEGIHPVSTEQQAELALIRNEMLVDAERYDEARDALNRVIGDQPDSIELLYARAMVAAQQNDVPALETDLRKVLKLNPDHVHSMNALGYTLADQTDRIKEAEELVSGALAKRPDDPFILDSYGWVKYRQGDLKEAEKYLQRALSLRNDPEIAAHLVEVLWVQGNKSEAQAIWNKANTDFPDNKLLNAVHNEFLQ